MPVIPKSRDGKIFLVNARSGRGQVLLDPEALNNNARRA